MIKQGRTMCALRYCAELFVKRIYFKKIKKAPQAAFPTKHSRIIADCRDGHWPSFAFQINLLKPM